MNKDITPNIKQQKDAQDSLLLDLVGMCIKAPEEVQGAKPSISLSEYAWLMTEIDDINGATREICSILAKNNVKDEDVSRFLSLVGEVYAAKVMGFSEMFIDI